MTRLSPTVLLLAALAAAPLPAADLQAGIDARIEALRDELIEIRRDLHRHPEVSGEEERTAGVVAARLEALGLEVETNVGGHGVLGLLRGAKPGPLVAYRADMDAVYSDAPDPVDFDSVNEGVRHICGHDVHTTIGLALAEGFAKVRDQLEGSVLFVFQPAEERATGARAMLAQGALESPKPAAIYALHTAPLEVGQLATAPNVMMAGRDRVRITVTGEGNLEEAARQLVGRLRGLGTLAPAEALAPQTGDFIVVQLAEPQKEGNAWVISGMSTTSNRETSSRAESAFGLEIDAATAGGVRVDLEYESMALAGVVNDPELTEHARASVGRIVGDENVVALDSLVPAFSEDFGSFQDVVPGVMFFLGVSNSEKGTVGMPHSPGYVADEEAIFVGAKAMAAVIVDRLARR